MGNEDRDPVATDQELLAVLANADEPLRSDEIADELPLPDEELPVAGGDLADRLDDLHERDLLEPAEEDLPGDRWRLAPGAGERIEISDEAVETEVEAQASKVTGEEAAARDAETPETPPPAPDEGEGEPLHAPAPDQIQAFDPPGTPEQKDRRRGTLRRAYVYLRRRGTATREDFEADVFPSAPGGYESPDGGWWEEVVRPGLDALPDVESVESEAGPTEDAEEWRFTGEQPPAEE